MITQSIKTDFEKIVVNAGIGRLATQATFEKILPELMKEMSVITGQKPSVRPARSSIAGFKIREGTTVGLKTTLRGARMAHFFEKLNAIVFPRVRDFRGIDPAHIDLNGNLSIGLKDHLVFPEVDVDASRVNFGLQITIVPRVACRRETAVELYRRRGVPFMK